MIDAATVFQLAGLLAIAGWLGLLVALFVPAARPIAWTAAQLLIPALLAAAYGLLLWNGWDAFEQGGFGSIEEVRALFANDSALTTGWLHYLAFDLFVGTFIARDGAARGVPALLILPCLPLTFMFGPLGLLLYLILRLALGRRAEPETV
jgi:hypothetical protein